MNVLMYVQYLPRLEDARIRQENEQKRAPFSRLSILDELLASIYLPMLQDLLTRPLLFDLNLMTNEQDIDEKINKCLEGLCEC